MNFIKNFFFVIKYKQYYKNIVIFIPFLWFSHTFLIPLEFFCAFLGFSFIANSIYILNDKIDFNIDKRNPFKKNKIFIENPTLIEKWYLFFSFFAFIGFLILFKIDFGVFFVSFIYFLINILYSLFLKNIIFLELFFIPLGFVLRLLIGEALIDNTVIPIDLYISIFLLSLFFTVSKRIFEVNLYIDKNIVSRKLVKIYTIDFLSFFLFVILVWLFFEYLLFLNIFCDIEHLFLNFSLLLLFFSSFTYERFKQPFLNNEKIIVNNNFVLVLCCLFLLDFFYLIIY